MLYYFNIALLMSYYLMLEFLILHRLMLQYLCSLFDVLFLMSPLMLHYLLLHYLMLHYESGEVYYVPLF